MTYADGTEGWSGSDTSRQRAEGERDTGTASKRQREILLRLAQVGPTGLTWSEVATALGVHHGSASASLTNLHKAGKIVRTARKRGRSKVYVLPQFVLDDDVTEPYRPNRSAAALRAEEADRRRIHLEGVIADARLAVLTGESSTKVLRILDEK
jgi:hypothetical protein